MTDPERDHLLHCLAESERARRRWKWLALAGTPVLAALLAMMAAFGTSSYLMLRDAIRREQAAGDSIWVDVDTKTITSLKYVKLVGDAEGAAKMPLEPEP